MSNVAGIGNQSSIVQTNVGPISFNGVASGIDWNSVIQKETALTLAPTTQYNQQIQKLSAQNTELIKINGLLASVQNAIVNLSDQSIYQTYTGTSSNTNVATATGIPGVPANPGTYTVTADSLATSTQVTSATASTVGKKTNASAALNAANFQITPTVPVSGQGQITIDGVAVKYSLSDSVGSSLNALLATIQFQVDNSVDAGFTASYNSATDEVTLKSTDAPISVGSQTDSGNLETVLKLDIGSVLNTGSSGFVQSAGPIGGLNQIQPFSNDNLITAVTAGTFTINGVQFNIQNTSTTALADVLQQINSSSAGVIATYNNATGQVQITNQQTGPRSIVFGSATDSSNFLAAVGLPVSVSNTTAVASEITNHQTVVAVSAGSYGSTTQVGQQASVTLQNPSGGTTTYYSGTNQVTNAIQGISINLISQATEPFTIQVVHDPTALIANIQAFATAYNAAINELNNALAAPVIQQNNPVTSNTSSTLNSSNTLLQGGPLFGDIAVQTLRDNLISYAQTIVGTSGTSYNSLDAIGLQLTSTFNELSATQQGAQSDATAGTTVSGSLTTQVMSGTDGTFEPFDSTTFMAAFDANPTAIQTLFNDPTSGIITQFGTYLTQATGSPTILDSGQSLGTIPSVSLLQADENTNSDSITSLQQYIQQIQDNATQQANQLQTQATNAETAIAGYQATQQQLSALSAQGGGL